MSLVIVYKCAGDVDGCVGDVDGFVGDVVVVAALYEYYYIILFICLFK